MIDDNFLQEIYKKRENQYEKAEAADIVAFKFYIRTKIFTYNDLFKFCNNNYAQTNKSIDTWWVDKKILRVYDEMGVFEFIY
jgi:hypothetical protein